MSEADYLGLLSWYLNVVDGMANPFYFEDERGNIFKVRFDSKSISFSETSYLRYQGTVVLEIQNA